MSKKGRCIIYGGGGFIGSHLCDELLSSNYEVTVFDKLNFSRRNIQHLDGRIKVIEGDFNNEVDLKNSLKGVDYVYHLVSSTLPASSNLNPIYDVETNLISTLRLLEECRGNSIKKIIFISSGGTVYGIPQSIPINENHPTHPLCSYGVVKKSIEEYLHMYHLIYGLEYNVFRLANPYGERQNPMAAQGAVAVFLNKALNSETIEIWGDGEVVRDYIYISDVINVLVRSLDVTAPEKIVNVGSGKGYSLNQILKYIESETNLEPKVVFTKARSIDVPVNILDNSLAKSLYSWSPAVDITEGIRLTHNYLLQNYYSLP
jgi:UDP-glucose 4-epimerase